MIHHIQKMSNVAWERKHECVRCYGLINMWELWRNPPCIYMNHTCEERGYRVSRWLSDCCDATISSQVVLRLSLTFTRTHKEAMLFWIIFHLALSLCSVLASSDVQRMGINVTNIRTVQYMRVKVCRLCLFYAFSSCSCPLINILAQRHTQTCIYTVH